MRGAEFCPKKSPNEYSTIPIVDLGCQKPSTEVILNGPYNLLRKKKLKANNIGKCIACVLIYHAFNYKRKQLPIRGTIAIT